jgi:hypothetical protein
MSLPGSDLAMREIESKSNPGFDFIAAVEPTWRRLIRERGWLRPRHRVYPTKPKEGIRATKPNEFWHIDVTVLKLLDGTRTNCMR